jgi:hypothetical protein
MHRAVCPALPPGMVSRWPGALRHRTVPRGTAGVPGRRKTAVRATRMRGPQGRRGREPHGDRREDGIRGREAPPCCRKDCGAQGRRGRTPHGPRHPGGARDREARRRSSTEWGEQGLGRKPCGAVALARVPGKDAWRGRSWKRPAPRIFRTRRLPSSSRTGGARRACSAAGVLVFGEGRACRAMDRMRR